MLNIAALKEKLTPEKEQLDRAWSSLQAAIKQEMSEIKRLGSKVIPEVDFDDLVSNGNHFSEETRKQIEKRGIVIVRQALSSSFASELLDELKSYMILNGEDPEAKDQTFYEVYWSKAQVKARQHPNLIILQKALLKLWHLSPHSDIDRNVDLSQPLLYIDRFRMRKPGDDKFVLRPHVDSGSITRWSDPLYKNSYREILSGNWENHDPFLVNGRGQSLMDMHCSFFRAFQGWTALTASGPGSGTLVALPLLKESIAYMMLRPLLSDVEKDEFPGYSEGKLLFPPEGYHSDLFEAFVTLGDMQPGDSVWWHPDMIHRVESVHNGHSANTVLYMPVGPDCPINRLYVERMRYLFRQGLAPPDFEKKPENELHYKDRAGWQDLSPEAKIMFGCSSE